MTTTPQAEPQATTEEELWLAPELWPKVDHLITEDEKPMDNIFSAKQQRLLVETLYSSWNGAQPGQSFFADTNIGLFARNQNPALVPDMLLSLDVQAPQGNVFEKRKRSYMIWEFGKPPDIVIEIVSNREGHEDTQKLRDYFRIAIAYYGIYDPDQHLGTEALRLFRLGETAYEPLSTPWLTRIGLGLALWKGEYEGMNETWLRWVDQDGNLIPTGKERAEAEHARAEAERVRAEAERVRAERLAARLRALGMDPDQDD